MVVPQRAAATCQFFHRLPNGADVRIEFGSYVFERRVIQTGPRTCADTVTVTLKPGRQFFEVHRLTNREPMFDSEMGETVTRCAFPPLVG